jgi:hypothetical protein
MATLTYWSTPDRLNSVEAIREVFAQSSLFREVALSEPAVQRTGEVAVDVSFDCGPTVFRVVGPSEAKVYAVLHELARAMVDVDRRHRTVC